MLWKCTIVSFALLGFMGSTLAAMAADSRPAAASKADQEAIKKQKVCPVAGQPLGSMGEPVKVTAKGRTAFLCCAGCKKKFLADPDKYFKKIDKQSEKKSDDKKSDKQK